MEKGRGNEMSQSDSNTEYVSPQSRLDIHQLYLALMPPTSRDDLKPNDTTTLVLRHYFQQVFLSHQSSSPSQTNEDGGYLNTAQVVEKLARKEPALLYFYHKIFPDAEYEKVVTEMVAKVIHDANESAKSPKMKPRSYVPPPNIRRPRTSDLSDKTSTVGTEDEHEAEARKLVLLSNLQGILRETIMLNELQDSQQRSELTHRMSVVRRVDVPYTPPSASVKVAVTVNEQESQAALSSGPAVKGIVGLSPPPSVLDLGFNENAQQASTSKGKGVETTNAQQNQAAPTSSFDPVNGKVEKEKSGLSEVALDFMLKGDAPQASTSKEKIAEKVDEQKTEAAPGSDHVNIKEKGSSAVPPPPPPVVVDPKSESEGTHHKHFASAQASTSKGKNKETTNEQNNRPTPIRKSTYGANVAQKAALSAVIIDFISKAGMQEYFTFSQASTSNGKSTEKVNEQKEAASRPEPVNIKVGKERVVPPPASPPPVRRRPRTKNVRQPEEIYVTSAHARDRADKTRHLRSGGRVVPKPEPVNSTKAETTAKAEPKPTENKSAKDASSSGTQTEPLREPKPIESSFAPRAETNNQYHYRPASSPPKPKPEPQYGESASSNRYGRFLPARGSPFTAQCSGITNESRRCRIIVRTTFDGANFKPLCQWHGEYYGSSKPKSLDPNEKESGRCSATTLKGTLCRRSADHYSPKSEYGYCWQHERMYGWNRVYS